MAQGIPLGALDDGLRQTSLADGLRTKHALCRSDRVRRGDILALGNASRPFFHALRRTPNHGRSGTRAHLTSESSSKQLAACRQNTRDTCLGVRAKQRHDEEGEERRERGEGERPWNGKNRPPSLLRPKTGIPREPDKTEPRRPMGGPCAKDVIRPQLRTALVRIATCFPPSDRR